MTFPRFLGATGATLVVGFAVRAVLLGGVDDRGVILAVAAAATLVAYAAVDRDEADAHARARALRLGGGAALLTVAAALVAALVVAVATRVDRTFDLTTDRRHALSAHTLQVLAGLDAPVEVLGFFPDGSPQQVRFEALARRYVEASPAVMLELVDPLRQPLRARELEVRFEAGEVVLRSEGRTDRLVGRFDEDALTDALTRVSAAEERTVCWIEGHGEAGPDDTQGAGGMGGFVARLEAQAWRVRPLGLAALDEGCDVVLVANPKADLLAWEQAALARWVLGGGRALVLLEPGVAPGFASSLERLGVLVGDDVVLDPDPARRPMGVEDPSVIVIPPDELRDHPVTAGLLGAVTVGIARSVAARPDTPGVASRSLVRAGPGSWAERDLSDAAATFAPDDDEARGEIPLAVVAEVSDPAAVPDPGPATPQTTPAEVEAVVRRTLDRALPGALTLAGATRLDDGLDADASRLLVRGVAQTLGVDLPVVPGETLDDLTARAHAAVAARLPPTAAPSRPPTPGGRLLVVGDAGFASNRMIGMGSHYDLTANALAWLAGDEALLGARPDELGDVLDLTGRDQIALALAALLGFPGLTALTAWWVLRRRRGA